MSNTDKASKQRRKRTRGSPRSRLAYAKLKAEATPTVRRSTARRFVLNRREDQTGTSGTGIVAEGVCFSNGKVALHWLSHFGAVNVYDSMDVTVALHGHDGDTVVEWRDP